MKSMRIGLDLAKIVFEVFAVDHQEQPLFCKTLKRNKVLAFFAQFEPCVVGIESCGGAHYWARELRKPGHEVRMMAPQFVTPYRKSDRTIAMMPRPSARRRDAPTCGLCRPRMKSSKRR